MDPSNHPVIFELSTNFFFNKTAFQIYLHEKKEEKSLK